MSTYFLLDPFELPYYERIQKKICRHKMSIMFNEICINEEMLPIYIYINIYMSCLIRKSIIIGVSTNTNALGAHPAF